MFNFTLIVVGLIISGIIILVETLFEFIFKGIVLIFKDFFRIRRR